MTERVGSVLIIEKTMPGECELCGSIAELRPYGPGGRSICVECGSRDVPGKVERMNEVLEKILEGATCVVHPNGEIQRVKP